MNVRQSCERPSWREERSAKRVEEETRLSLEADLREGTPRESHVDQQ
jgi:hypothetical protein